MSDQTNHSEAQHDSQKLGYLDYVDAVNGFTGQAEAVLQALLVLGESKSGFDINHDYVQELLWNAYGLVKQAHELDGKVDRRSSVDKEARHG